FNKKRILDGSSGALWSSSDSGVKVRVKGGLTSTDKFGHKVSSEGNYRIEVKAEAGQCQVQKTNIMTTYKTNVDYGADAEPEEVTETVRTVVTEATTSTQSIETPTVNTTEEPYVIYLNAQRQEDDVLKKNLIDDNFVSSPDVTNQAEIEAVRNGWNNSDGVLTISANGTYNIKGWPDENGNILATTNRIKVDSGLTDVNIFLTDVNIDLSRLSDACPFEISSGSTVNVYLSGNNILKSGGKHAALEVPDGATLILSSADGDGQETGTLTAEARSGAFYGAGIGGAGTGVRSNGRAGNITINGGTITAKGGTYGAGIGGGDTGSDDGCGTIVINGGKITATGGSSAAGIGSGDGREMQTLSEDSITINGGTIIKATGGTQAAGIGGGYMTHSGTIIISSHATIEEVSGWIDTESGNTEAIGRGQGGPILANDSITYTDDEPVLRTSVPDRLNIVVQSTVINPEDVEITTYESHFEETTAAISVTPPPSLVNDTEDVTFGSSVASLSAKGLPAGRYTVSTLESALTSTSFQLTGSYGFNDDLLGLLTMSAGTGTLAANANILFEVTSVNRSSGTVNLRATANLMSTDGTMTKHIVRENITLKEGNASALSGLNLTGSLLDYDSEEANPAVTLSLASGGASSFSVGNKFVYNIAAPGSGREGRTVEISGTQDSAWERRWGSNLSDKPLRFGLDADAVIGSTLTFSNFYLSSTDGTVYEGDMILNIGRIRMKNGSELAKFNALRDNPITTTDFSTADENTKLTEIIGLYDTNEVFMIDTPQNVTITDGGGRSASVTIYSSDTIGELCEKLNDAIANGLKQKRYTDTNKFVSFVTEDSAQYQGLESVPGTFIVRSAVPGKEGELSFSGDNDLLNALGLNTIQESSESRFTVSISDAHSGKIISSGVKTTGNVINDAVTGVDVEFDSMAGIISTWSESTKRFVTSGTTYTA
ncbi:MAG: hypothetical protein IJR27_03865, partial [Synergistaceae bacterium]|nr:hypothetical protein [Synergistaceae bacterium]